MSPKKIIKKIIPAFVFQLYHFLMAKTGQIVYGFPTNKMVVVGVTGTKGKTSTVNFIRAVFSANGEKAGMISSANINNGRNEKLNNYHMSMPGRFTIPKLMKEMVKNGCRYCVIETTSEGIKQYRHSAINYDYAVFTNLSPEHLSSHKNSFEEYKKAKGKMFQQLTKGKKKKLNGKKIEKVIIANKDDDNSDYFLSFRADKKITFSIKESSDFQAEKIEEKENGVSFSLKENNFYLKIPGAFNVYNALPAIIIGEREGIPLEKIRNGLASINLIPGRMEKIERGQNFTVFVDYAHEGKSIKAALQAVNKIKGEGKKTIILLGAEGGGRDKRKRPIMGREAAELADYVIVSNVDPYEDNPREIIEDITVAAERAGKTRGKNLFAIEDRRKGIKKSLSLAKEGDIVLITGKGAEQSITINGKKYPWDDRKVVSQELGLILKNN